MEDVGKFLKNFRKNNKMTGAKLAEVLGCSQQYISQMESGKKPISIEKLEILKDIMTEAEYTELINAVNYEKLKNIPGQVEILNKNNIVSYKIPYFKDIQASAGYGSMNGEKDDNLEYIEVPATLKSSYNIAVRVSGDSMEPEFKNDDIVIINTCLNQVKYDKFFVVNYDDYVYLKKIIKKDDKAYLHSVNPYYPDLEIKDCEKLKVIGQVITVLRNY